jgi:hypothetical protein
MVREIALQTSSWRMIAASPRPSWRRRLSKKAREGQALASSIACAAVSTLRRQDARLWRSPQGDAQGHRDPDRRHGDLRRFGHQARERLRDLSTILCSGNRDEERLALAVDAHQEGPVLPARLGPFFGEI